MAPLFDAWLAPFKDIGARRNVPERIGNTDHLSFTALGLPGFNPIQDYVDYDVRTHHTNMDTFERVRRKGHGAVRGRVRVVRLARGDAGREDSAAAGRGEVTARRPTL